jgi:hypothetical protein
MLLQIGWLHDPAKISRQWLHEPANSHLNHSADEIIESRRLVSIVPALPPCQGAFFAGPPLAQVEIEVAA